ncbi:hypothetical protein AB0D10_18215 [Kitasatospora sp. NPDC048545]|uniref:hypothetical protein n=1 Tax=Kitasatospora sp. NPDC048545 TaxID=3157208 RepID=UPI0033E3F218
MPALFREIPPHVADWRKPLRGEDNATVRPYTPKAVVDPIRRAAAFAALDLPDPVNWLADAATADQVLAGAGV